MHVLFNWTILKTQKSHILTSVLNIFKSITNQNIYCNTLTWHNNNNSNWFVLFYSHFLNTLCKMCFISEDEGSDSPVMSGLETYTDSYKTSLRCKIWFFSIRLHVNNNFLFYCLIISMPSKPRYSSNYYEKITVLLSKLLYRYYIDKTW